MNARTDPHAERYLDDLGHGMLSEQLDPGERDDVLAELREHRRTPRSGTAPSGSDRRQARRCCGSRRPRCRKSPAEARRSASPAHGPGAVPRRAAGSHPCGVSATHSPRVRGCHRRRGRPARSRVDEAAVGARRTVTAGPRRPARLMPGQLPARCASTALLLDEMLPPQAASLLREDAPPRGPPRWRPGDGPHRGRGDRSVTREHCRGCWSPSNAADFAGERGVVLRFGLRRNLPAGAGMAAGAREAGSPGGRVATDPWPGQHWLPLKLGEPTWVRGP